MKASSPPDRLTKLLATVFFLSGLASLVYQVAWQRMLTLHYGVGSVSIAVIVTIYMFGLGLGALVGGFLAERVKRRLLLYFVVELLIGCFGLASLPLLRLLGQYTAGSGYLMSSAYVFAFFSIPTVLMGLTLPLLTKIYNAVVGDFLRTVSVLYFINTLGAAVGSILASYVLISLFGVDRAIYVAAGINVALAGLIWLARDLPRTAPMAEASFANELRPSEAPLGRWAYLLVLLTGFLAIGYEIVWFRIIGVLVKASPYAFSTVLGVYLIGIALGSRQMDRYLTRQPGTNRRRLFFHLQFCIGLTVMVGIILYFYLTKYTPLESFTHASFSGELHPPGRLPLTDSTKHFLRDIFCTIDIVIWPAIFVLVPTLLMGASFPLISDLAMRRPGAEGRTVGTVYAFNIVGNVLGGLVTGFVLLATLGTERTLLIFTSAGLLIGLLSIRWKRKPLPLGHRVATVGVLLAVNVALMPGRTELYRAMHRPPDGDCTTYVEEGTDTVVVTHQAGDLLLNYISGLGHGARPGPIFQYEALEAAAHSAEVTDVLVIGFGTGTVVETILKLPEVESLTLVELSPSLMTNLKKMTLFRGILADDRVELIIDDGRQYLLRTDRAYDLVLIDALRTTTSHSNNLYAKEFFDLVGRHLTDGGVLMVWMDEDRVMPATVASSFEHLRRYSHFCLASNRPMRTHTQRRQQLLADYSADQQKRIERQDRYLGGRPYVMGLSEGYPINREWRPICEYYLGLRLRKLFRHDP